METARRKSGLSIFKVRPAVCVRPGSPFRVWRVQHERGRMVRVYSLAFSGNSPRSSSFRTFAAASHLVTFPLRSRSSPEFWR